MSVDWTPGQIAAADQELAAVSAIVDQLAQQWTLSQPYYNYQNLDRLDRLVTFLRSDVFRALGWNHIHIGMAVALEKLAQK